MDPVGINTPLVLAQLCNVALLLAWLVLAATALLRLRRAALPAAARAIWAALIVLVPLLGALAFFIVRPGSGAAPSA